jgi:hypothetical protein
LSLISCSTASQAPPQSSDRQLPINHLPCLFCPEAIKYHCSQQDL